MNDVYKIFRNEGVEFIGISIWDSPDDAARFYDEESVVYPSGLDRASLIAIDYGVTGIPEKHFINREGQVIHKIVGPVGNKKLQEILWCISWALLGSPSE